LQGVDPVGGEAALAVSGATHAAEINADLLAFGARS